MFIAYKVSLTDCFSNMKETTGQGQVDSNVGDGKRNAEQGEHSLVRGHMGRSGQ